MLLTSLCSLGVSACQGDEPTGTTEIFCTAMCERATQCGGWDDVSTCEGECGAREHLEDFKPAFVSTFAACFQRLSCAVYFSEGSFDPCWKEAREGFEPDAETRAFCDGRSRFLFECGFWYFPDQCERDWAVRAGAALNRVAECQRTAMCEDLGSCTEAALAGGQ